MGRPTAKTDLLTAATANYEKLNYQLRLIFQVMKKRKKLIGKEIKIFVIFSFISMNGISFC